MGDVSGIKLNIPESHGDSRREIRRRDLELTEPRGRAVSNRYRMCSVSRKSSTAADFIPVVADVTMLIRGQRDCDWRHTSTRTVITGSAGGITAQASRSVAFPRAAKAPSAAASLAGAGIAAVTIGSVTSARPDSRGRPLTYDVSECSE